MPRPARHIGRKHTAYGSDHAGLVLYWYIKFDAKVPPVVWAAIPASHDQRLARKDPGRES